jgi:hypothetical protein
METTIWGMFSLGSESGFQIFSDLFGTKSPIYGTDGCPVTSGCGRRSALKIVFFLKTV